MSGVFRRVRDSYRPHRYVVRRVGVAMLAVALGLVVVGGAIRVVRSATRRTPPAATSASPSDAWTATLDAPVTGLAVDENRLFVASDHLLVFPLSCVVADDECQPRWQGVVAGGPLSVPVISDERAFAGSAEGQLYAFPSTCTDGCTPEWIGEAGSGPVSEPAANFDFVYVTSDELSVFPVGCATDGVGCTPAWSADVPGRPAGGAPALGEGLVVVGSASKRGGVTAYPAVCGAECEPVWTARFDGPATSVAIGDGLAYTVARGRLLAFPLSCAGRCEPEWRALFTTEAASPTGKALTPGAEGAPVFADGRVLVGGTDGTLWVFASSCESARCEPIDSYDLGSTPLLTPAIDDDTAIVTSMTGDVTRIDLSCEPADACAPVTLLRLGSPALTPAVIASDTAIAGAADGSLEAVAR